MNQLESIVCVNDAPSGDDILWRYMDFAKFVSILENRALFFVRADRLNDPFEGTFPKKNVEKRQANLHPEFEEAMTISGFQTFNLFWKRLPRFTLVNCWHESKHESEAMWKVYSSLQGGIAIKTRFDNFVQSFRTKKRIHIGRVNYVDYENERIPEDNPLSPYLYKRESFAHEREVRAIIQDIPTGNVTGIPEIYKFGDYCEVDMNKLIQEIVVAPSADDWFLDLVKLVSARYKLQAKIDRSPLAELPPL